MVRPYGILWRAIKAAPGRRQLKATRRQRPQLPKVFARFFQKALLSYFKNLPPDYIGDTKLCPRATLPM
jgi:hypothetical protein